MLVQVLQTYNGRRGQLFFYRTPFPRRRIPFSGDGGSPRFFGCAEKPLRREKLGRNNFCRRPVSFWPPFSFLFRFFLFGLAWKNCSTPTQKMWRPIRQSTRIPFPFLDLSFFLRAHSSSSSFSSSSSSFFFFSPSLRFVLRRADAQRNGRPRMCRFLFPTIRHGYLTLFILWPKKHTVRLQKFH